MQNFGNTFHTDSHETILNACRAVRKRTYIYMLACINIFVIQQTFSDCSVFCVKNLSLLQFFPVKPTSAKQYHREYKKSARLFEFIRLLSLRTSLIALVFLWENTFLYIF